MTLGVWPEALKSSILSKDIEVEFNNDSASLMNA